MRSGWISVFDNKLRDVGNNSYGWSELAYENWIAYYLVIYGKQVFPSDRNNNYRRNFAFLVRQKSGAVDWDRTSDLLVTNELLCQLSYNGMVVLYHMSWETSMFSGELGVSRK